jgi:hypothetical protein
VIFVGALNEAAGWRWARCGRTRRELLPHGPDHRKQVLLAANTRAAGPRARRCLVRTRLQPLRAQPMWGRRMWGRPTLEAAAASDFARELGLLSAFPRADAVARGAVRVASPLAQAPDRDGHNSRARSAPALPLFRNECPRPKELGAKTAPTPLLASRDLLKCALKHISLCVFFRPARCWKCS